MATDMQARTLDAVVEAGRTKKRIIKRQVLRQVGYSKDVQDQPQKVFESKGFLELCDELGLTDNFLTKALVEDIKKKPGKRTAELKLGFEVRGRLKDNEGGSTYNQFNFFGEDQLKRIARRVQDGNSESERAPH